jgi:short-subunit dehydrogenase
MRKLVGEVAIVTGASSGIGAATANELAQRGARVVLAARRAEELSGLAQALKVAGYEALAVPADVSDAAQVRRLVERAVEAFGRVDVLVNNAGVGSDGPLAEMAPEAITNAVAVNLLGAMQTTRAVLPGMLERRHGAIISVASVAGHVAVSPVYSATKFGLRGFSLSLRRELRGTGVSVSLVSPGFIRTPLTAGMRQRLPGPEIVARAIAWLVVHPRREVVVPRRYRFAIWAERFVPGVVDRAVGR